MRLNRREFLKYSSLLASTVPYYWSKPGRLSSNPNPKNVIILIFDAWSVKNIPLYGYPRNTTPNLLRIAEGATVYHNHIAGGHETYTSTTAFLTGADNWTTWDWGLDYEIHPPFNNINLFGLFDDYYRIAYTHNYNAERVLDFFLEHINLYQPLQSLFLNNDDWLRKYFSHDYETANLSWVRIADVVDDRYTNSLLMSKLIEIYRDQTIAGYYKDFPLGPPVVTGPSYFLLEDAINWIMEQVGTSPTPFLGYFHLWPPHDKYTPRSQDWDTFKGDGLKPDLKSLHPLANRKNDENLYVERKHYDEYILYVDDELGRLFTYLEEKGILEDTWFILTSDHGDSFERGILGHKQDTFHQPITHIPLLVFEPGRKQRRDVYEYTGTVDLLPTLLHITGHEVPPEVEGRVIPPYNPDPLGERTFHASTWAKSTSIDWRLRTAVMMVKGQYKLMRYEGYKGLPTQKPYYEIYDLDEDPEELKNLYSAQSPFAVKLIEELEEKILSVDKSTAGRPSFYV